MTQWTDYLAVNKQRFLEELSGWLRIPSVSTDPSFRNDVFEAAEYLKNRLQEAGADDAKIIPTPGYPVVYAEKIVDKTLPTVLVYGHYDVQPADPYDLWTSPPFEPRIAGGCIYARGASDDKGQTYMHVKALEMMAKTGTLPCNLKFMIEGEEEVGSASLGKFLASHRRMLSANVVLVSDTSMISGKIPSITVGLRGLSYVEAEVTGPDRDLHSGVYGGAVANPVNVLCRMIASLKDKNNRITLPGFYDGAERLSPAGRKELAKVPFSMNAYKKELGVRELEGEKGYKPWEHTSIRPTLDVNGIWGGYTGQGAKTVLPSKAFAKISMRLVPGQDPEKITKLFTKHFLSIAPKSVKVKVTPHHGGWPVVTPTGSPAYRAASRAMETTFCKRPIPVRTGGSIPVVPLFEKVLGLKSILMGFGLDSDNIHSPNERFGLLNYYKGIETIPYFHKYFAEECSKS